MNVELHIERLALTGVPLPPGGRAALAGAFGRELTRLIQDGGLAPALLGGTGAAHLTATLSPAAPARADAGGAGTGVGGTGGPGAGGPGAGSRLGRELARSVYSCLGGN